MTIVIVISLFYCLSLDFVDDYSFKIKTQLFTSKEKTERAIKEIQEQDSRIREQYSEIKEEINSFEIGSFFDFFGHFSFKRTFIPSFQMVFLQ